MSAPAATKLPKPHLLTSAREELVAAPGKLEAGAAAKGLPIESGESCNKLR